MRLRTLVSIRWFTIGGQALALLFVNFSLGFPVPLPWSFATIGVYLAINLALFLIFSTAHRLNDRSARWQLALDILQLAVLLGLTGGLENPFVLLLLAPVAISATILSVASTVVLAVLAIVAASVLAFFHLPLPLGDADSSVPDLYIAGVWSALGLGIGFIAIYAWLVASEARRLADALGAAERMLARTRQVSALGALAAAAAHELGTPLGTIALIIREIEKDLSSDHPLAPDVALLRQEIRKCRDILASLAQERSFDARSPHEVLAIGAMVEEVLNLHRRQNVAVHFNSASSAAALKMRRRPEMIHALGNLLQNAMDFAVERVDILVLAEQEQIEIQIRDDGPGIPVDMLEALGDPYVTSRRNEGGMGLGVFIARTLLESVGARITFANHPEGGCQVRISWARADLSRIAPVNGAGDAVEYGDGI